MTLIKSISGIRGTIGGNPGEALTPLDVVKFTYAYCEKMKERRPKADGERYKVVVGKDARLSGDMVEQLVCGTLVACGVDVVKAGFASTPTTEMAVVFEQADGAANVTARGAADLFKQFVRDGLACPRFAVEIVEGTAQGGNDRFGRYGLELKQAGAG